MNCECEHGTRCAAEGTILRLEGALKTANTEIDKARAIAVVVNKALKACKISIFKSPEPFDPGDVELRRVAIEMINSLPDDCGESLLDELDRLRHEAKVQKERADQFSSRNRMIRMLLDEYDTTQELRKKLIAIMAESPGNGWGL